MDKVDDMLELWCSAPGIEFVNAEAEQAYKKRVKRIADVIQMKVPDRVPVVLSFGFFYAKYAGITAKEAHYDYDKWRIAVKKTVKDFEPDMYANPRLVLMAPGPLLDMLDFRQIKWPGHGVSPQHSFQFVEGEYMKAEEYDAFLQDPSDYVIRTYLPRIYGVFEPFRRLPPLRSMMGGYAAAHLVAAVARPEIAGAMETLAKAGAESLRWRSSMDSLLQELTEMGFPRSAQASAMAPYDVIGDFLRGTRGIMLDMYRQPEKLIEATEKVLPMQLEGAVFIAKHSGNPIVFIPLHKGAEGFMSPQQFQTFYWPTLLKLIEGLADEGLVPWLFFEGDYTSRLEIIRHMPKGKTICHFELTDIFRAKEVLGSVACIRGGIPNLLLCTGTTKEVKEHCRRLVDVVGQGGGFIMDTGAIVDEANPENMKAMIDFTKEYGVYSQ